MRFPRTLYLFPLTVFVLFLTTVAHAGFVDGMISYIREDYGQPSTNGSRLLRHALTIHAEPSIFGLPPKRFDHLEDDTRAFS